MCGLGAAAGGEVFVPAWTPASQGRVGLCPDSTHAQEEGRIANRDLCCDAGKVCFCSLNKMLSAESPTGLHFKMGRLILH